MQTTMERRHTFSLEVQWLDNHLFHVEMHPRIATPLASLTSPQAWIGLPRKVGFDVSARLELIDHQGSLQASYQLELLFTLLLQGRAQQPLTKPSLELSHNLHAMYPRSYSHQAI